MHAGAGPQVHDMIRRQDGVGVVLDDNHGVARVAQRGQRAEQACIVALMQTDGGFIQDVHDAGEARAHLARQADALGLPAREGLGAAVQGQVVQPHILEEAQTIADILENPRGHFRAPAGQVQAAQRRQGIAHRQMGDLRQRVFARRTQSARCDSGGCPPQSGQACVPRYLASSSRTRGDWVSR